MTFVWTIVSWPCRWHKPHTHKQIQATHCLSSLHPGPALAVTRCHPKSITIVYVLILFLSLGVTTHGTHKKTSFDMYALSRSWSRLRVLVTTSNGVLRLVRTVPVLVLAHCHKQIQATHTHISKIHKVLVVLAVRRLNLLQVQVMCVCHAVLTTSTL